MNPVRWKYLAAVFFCLSLTFLAATLVLPLVKSQQEVFYQGPAVSYFGGDTAVSGYYIPTVDQGSMVKIAVSNFVPGGIELSVFPTKEGEISPTGGSVFFQTLPSNITVSFTSKSAQAYGIYVISYNGTTYVMRVSAVFSSYFWLTAYTFVGTAASLSSGILLYYYSFSSRRWKLEQQAIREAKQGASTKKETQAVKRLNPS
ncbi:MAG: hypothetical protein OK452_11175 [Thaumarchaeota archaeon]|nr:hypothetical protein [Nitrososphaerota archaeon]